MYRKTLSVVTALSCAGAFLAARPAAGQSAGAANASLPAPYVLSAAVRGLDFPTAVAFSETAVWVAEAGHLGDPPPRVKRVDLETGAAVTILEPSMLPAGTFLGPLTDVTFEDGHLWAVHRQTGANGWRVGAISRFRPEDPAGTFETVITDLPSAGDHTTDEIVFTPEGRALFSQGTATNASVVGPDNELVTGWLVATPTFHDFAPRDLVLNGVDFPTPVPFPLDSAASAFTGPYQPFGQPADVDQLVPAATPSTPQEGMVAGNGALYSFDPDAAVPVTTLTLEAWGLRNPFGLALDPLAPGTAFVTNNGSDVRSALVGGMLQGVGSRPIANDADDLFAIELGGDQEFLGWPDFLHDPSTGAVLPVTDPSFQEPGRPQPDFVLAESFRTGLVTSPALAQFETHSSANKLDVSTTSAFGFEGNLFVAETGAFVPSTGADVFAGYKVVRVDRTTGEVSDFLVNLGTTPETLFPPDGFHKPIDAKFQGDRLVVVDFGVFEPGLGLSEPATGTVWLVTVDSGTTSTTVVTSTTIVPSTTTTLPGCVDAPTLDSASCRLGELLERVEDEDDLGKLQAKLGHTLGKALRRIEEAETACDGGDATRAKKDLRKVVRSLIQFGHRLRSLSGRRIVSDDLRADLIAAGRDLQKDVQRLKRDGGCQASSPRGGFL
jgi:hypothetical protein